MNITLIGYRGTGKSTIARLVASRLQWHWVDADALLEERAKRSIREIFAAEGEAGFREREARLIAELTARDRFVIAAGGGVVLRPESRLAIRRTGFTVWLTANPATILQRISADPTTSSRRPPLTNGDSLSEVCQLLGEREPLYRQCADLIVDTEVRTPDQIAQQIVEAFAVRQQSTAME